VAADAGVEFVTAGMLDGDDIEWRSIVFTLGKSGDRETVDSGWFGIHGRG
jgi:hypothetical protein